MKVDRAALLKQIRTVAPAVASKSPVEALMHIWFDGAVALAYNDVIGIECPCTIPVQGGVMGSTLVGMLDKSLAKEVEITPSDAEIVLKQAGARAKLPVLPVEQMISPFPSEALEPTCAIDATFVAALAHVMLSVATTGTYVGTGITVKPEGEVLAFYTTDARSLSWAYIALPENYSVGRVNLSPSFVERLLDICDEPATLYLTDDNAVVVTESGVRLFGRLLEAPKELDFAGAIGQNVDDKMPRLPVPEKLALVLERTQVLVSGGQVARVSAELVDGVMRLNMSNKRGDLHEAISVKAPKGTKMETVFDSALVLRGLPTASAFIMNDRCFALFTETGDGYMCAPPTSSTGES